MTAKELLYRMPKALDPQAAAEIAAVIQYETSEPVYQILEGGVMTVRDGRAEAPDLVLRIGDADLVELFSGRLNPMNAFMMGKLKLTGDVALARKLVGLIDRDKLAEEQ